MNIPIKLILISKNPDETVMGTQSELNLMAVAAENPGINSKIEFIGNFLCSASMDGDSTCQGVTYKSYGVKQRSWVLDRLNAL